MKALTELWESALGGWLVGSQATGHLTLMHTEPFSVVQVRLHMMCANHPNIVQILEVYANSVQFPHESSPRWRLLCLKDFCVNLHTCVFLSAFPLTTHCARFPSLPRARLLIVMEMMEGGELFHRISQHRHFTEKMASQVTKQVGGEKTHQDDSRMRIERVSMIIFRDLLSKWK